MSKQLVGGVKRVEKQHRKKGSYDLQTQHELSKATETKYTVQSLLQKSQNTKISPDKTGLDFCSYVIEITIFNIYIRYLILHIKKLNNLIKERNL